MSVLFSISCLKYLDVLILNFIFTSLYIWILGDVFDLLLNTLHTVHLKKLHATTQYKNNKKNNENIFSD